jgi:hypothetical protein
MTKHVSRCCGALIVVAGPGTTHWYVCTACQQPTDPAPAGKLCHEQSQSRHVGDRPPTAKT